ncbi:hypothetical protein CDD83_10652 [Cordyceps sp. RAO-2017]|nr:hypothetical protein CDD83_10652 [Cordyceps sp. RAO-2017]
MPASSYRADGPGPCLVQQRWAASRTGESADLWLRSGTPTLLALRAVRRACTLSRYLGPYSKGAQLLPKRGCELCCCATCRQTGTAGPPAARPPPTAHRLPPGALPEFQQVPGTLVRQQRIQVEPCHWATSQARPAWLMGAPFQLRLGGQARHARIGTGHGNAVVVVDRDLRRASDRATTCPRLPSLSHACARTRAPCLAQPALDSTYPGTELYPDVPETSTVPERPLPPSSSLSHLARLLHSPNFYHRRVQLHLGRLIFLSPFLSASSSFAAAAAAVNAARNASLSSAPSSLASVLQAQPLLAHAAFFVSLPADRCPSASPLGSASTRLLAAHEA